MDEREKLAVEIGDPELVHYFYLDMATLDLVGRLDGLSMRLTETQDAVPFNAQVKGYFGGEDEEGHPWILKPAADSKEILYHRLCGLAYLLDHRMGTLAAPTTLVRIGGKPYRAIKVVRNAIQISSYNYLEQPFVDIFRADLVNRWLYFDEDRNPNNYLVIHNAANRPFVVAIDYDKADLEAERMKITGIPDKFGWQRSEKTRFLTLLRPEHFQSVPLCVFEPRLLALSAIPESEIRSLARRLLAGCVENSEEYAEKIAANLIARRAYIDDYFRKMFKSASETKDISHNDDYSAFGQSFLDMYKDKK